MQSFHGRRRGDTTVEAIYWDGVTDYTQHQNLTQPGPEVGEEEEEDKRLDDFGEWLDNQQNLPPEFQLQVGS
jgi:hypothetical protein